MMENGLGSGGTRATSTYPRFNGAASSNDGGVNLMRYESTDTTTGHHYPSTNGAGRGLGDGAASKKKMEAPSPPTTMILTGSQFSTPSAFRSS